MRKPRTSVYLHFGKPDSQAVTKGSAWLRGALEALGRQHALLAVGAKADLDRGLADILDARRIRQFKKHLELPWDGMLLQLMTLQRPATGWDGPALALYPSARLLDAVDDIERVPAVCVIACDRVETQSWIYRWNASVLDLQNPLPAWDLPSFSNPVVETKLRELTRRVNLETGIIDPSDRAEAIACFTALRAEGIRYNSLEIENWLITRGGLESKRRPGRTKTRGIVPRSPAIRLA